MHRYVGVLQVIYCILMIIVSCTINMMNRCILDIDKGNTIRSKGDRKILLDCYSNYHNSLDVEGVRGIWKLQYSDRGQN